MGVPYQIDRARRWFAEDLRVSAPISRNQRIVAAFREVPRELYLGEGPWIVHPRFRGAEPYLTPTNDPAQVYHDVLVAIDPNRDLNNGQPSLWAHVFDNLDIAVGASVLQVGTGAGYFTAILAEIVGPGGRVISFEVDAELAEQARSSLKTYDNIEVIGADATTARGLPELDAIVVCAGATHPPIAWLRHLGVGGRMMLPLTGRDHTGFMLLVERQKDLLRATSLGPCGFYDCVGARRDNEAEELTKALSASDGTAPPLDQLHLGRPTNESERLWYACHNSWISTQ